MFDIGFSELLVIAIVALVVLGPERLPKAARFAGLWVRRARNQWDSVKQELERELQAEDIRRQMQDVRRTMQDTGDALRASGEAAQRQMQDIDAQGRSLVGQVRGPAGTVDGAPGPLPDTVDEASPGGDGPLPADVRAAAAPRRVEPLP